MAGHLDFGPPVFVPLCPPGHYPGGYAGGCVRILGLWTFVHVVVAVFQSGSLGGTNRRLGVNDRRVGPYRLSGP